MEDRQQNGIRAGRERVHRRRGGTVASRWAGNYQEFRGGGKSGRPGTSETTALGAAYLAGLATGFWKNREEIGKQWNRERVFHPAMEKAVRERQISRWKKAVARARDWEEDSQAGS